MKLHNALKLLSSVKLYWKRPLPGRYMPFKEIVAYSVGGIGAYFLIYCAGTLMLSTTNMIIGNAIGIEPSIMYVLYIIATLVSFPSTAIRANIIDNARSKKGKYRPYMLYMAIPTSLLIIGMVMIPYERISSQIIKGIIVLLFNIGFQFFYMFFYDSYENLIMVLSPDTQERADVMAIKSEIYSLAPTIATAILPLAANWITDGSLVDMNLYRALYIPFGVIGVLCAVYIYANTQEKIVQARTHVIRIKFTDALRSVARNKYFWVISLAGWLGFLESTYLTMMSWCYQYHNTDNEMISAGAYSILGILVGSGAFWGMLICPFAIRRYGKKKVMIITNALNIVFLGIMYPIVRNDPHELIWFIAICLFANQIVGSFGIVLTPSINADIRDYQQYITGERIDGMFSTVGLIGTVITMITSSVVPSAYEALGINQKMLDSRLNEIVTATGKAAEEVSQSVYNVLYLRDIFVEVFCVIVAFSVVGAVLNVIPYFFYDMTEIRQRGIIKVLQLRAMFEDYGNGVLKDRDVVSTIDMIEESSRLADACPRDLKALKRTIRQQHSRADKNVARKEYRAAAAYNDNIEISKIVMQEMNKFQTPEWQFKLEEAQKLYAEGLDGLTSVTMEYLNEVLSRAKEMPKKTKAEKEERSAAIASAKERIFSKKEIEGKHNGHIELFDSSVFEVLFEREDNNLAVRTRLEEQLHAAKKSKDHIQVPQLKAKIKELKSEKKVIDADIKRATDENSIYNRLAKPYVDAQKLIAQAGNYTHYEEIKAMYKEAKARSEEAARIAEEKEKELEAERKAIREKSRRRQR